MHNEIFKLIKKYLFKFKNFVFIIYSFQVNYKFPLSRHFIYDNYYQKYCSVRGVVEIRG